MTHDYTDHHRLTEQSVQEDFRRQPHLFMRLAENAFTVAESLRGNYFKNTAAFILDLRKAIDAAAQGRRTTPLLDIHEVADTSWSTVQNEVVTFIDGGVGQVQLASQVPILLRVGSYRVRTGERHLSEREQFGYYPVILGDLEGGSKDRKDFVDIVRIIAELLAGLSALERTPDLRVLMFHGPLVYLVGAYAGHTPFTEQDIDTFLRQYADDPSLGQKLKEEFLHQARLYIYPNMTDRPEDWYQNRLFEPLAFMAFLYRYLIAKAQGRSPTPLITGVTERGNLREFSKVLLDRVFIGLKKNNRANYFNEMFGRSDLNKPDMLLEKLGYTDSLLLAMILRPGQYSEDWEIDKYQGLRAAKVSLPNISGRDTVQFEYLKPGTYGFPRVRGCYLHVSETTEPVRIEVFDEFADQQLLGLPSRAVDRARYTALGHQL